MKISKYCCALCLMGLLGVSAVLPNAAALAKDITHTTDPVMVTATRVGRDLHHVPMSVGVVTAEDIKKNPATTIGELVRDIPGVELAQSSPGLIRISIRGEDDRRTLILIDGQKISEQKSMDGTPILVDPANVERIEVIKGPASVLYGSDAIGGVLNIITKKSTKDAIHGSVSLTYTGQDNGLTESANLYGHYQGWNYQLSASNSMHNKTSTPYGYLPNTGYGQQNFEGALSYDFTPNITAGVSASYFHFDSITGYPVLENGKYVAKSYDASTNTFTDFPFLVDIPSWSRTKLGAFFEAKDITDYFVRLRADVFYQHTYKKMRNYVDVAPVVTTSGPMTMTVDPLVDKYNYNNLHTIGFSLQSDWAIGDNHYFIAGYDFMHDTLDAKSSSYGGASITGFMPFPPPGSTIVMSSYDNTDEKFSGTQTTHALYLAGESTFWDELSFHYGARYTSVITGMSQAHESVNGGAYTATGLIGSDIASRMVFNAGFVWTPMEELALRAHWGQGFRVPRLDEMYFSSTMGGGIIEKNPDLKPETSNNFEIGARYSDGGFTADVAAFYSVAQDYIASVVIDAATDTFQNQNIAEAHTHGVEASLSYTFDNGIKPYISATYMRRQYKADTYSTWDTNTPVISGRAGIAYFGSHFNDTVDINADVYVRGQGNSSSYSASEDKTYNYHGYATFNAAVGASFGPDKAWNVQAEVLNIFNTHYRAETTYPYPVEPGTSFNLRVSYSF